MQKFLADRRQRECCSIPLTVRGPAVLCQAPGAERMDSGQSDYMEKTKQSNRPKHPFPLTYRATGKSLARPRRLNTAIFTNTKLYYAFVVLFRHTNPGKAWGKGIIKGLTLI